MSFSAVFAAMVKLFLILLVGFASQKLNLLPMEAQTVLTKLVLYFSTPCTIVYSVLTNEQQPGAKTILLLIGIALVSYLIAFVVGIVFNAATRVPRGSKGCYLDMLLFSNAGFIGYPVCQTVFGGNAVFLAAIFNIPFNAIAFSFGAYLLIRDSAELGSEGGKVSIKASQILNPCLIASLIAILFSLTGWGLPGVVTDAIGMFDKLTTPCALLSIGLSIGKMPASTMLGSPRIYALSVVRLVVIPVMVWFVLHLFITDPMILGVAVVIFAMPAAMATAMMAAEYGADEKTAVQGAFLTTVLSMISIPCLMTILM